MILKSDGAAKFVSNWYVSIKPYFAYNRRICYTIIAYEKNIDPRRNPHKTDVLTITFLNKR